MGKIKDAVRKLIHEINPIKQYKDLSIFYDNLKPYEFMFTKESREEYAKAIKNFISIIVSTDTYNPIKNYRGLSAIYDMRKKEKTQS